MRRLDFLVFAACLAPGLLLDQPVEYDNSMSRHLLIGAIADHGELSIDYAHRLTLDKSYAGGHYYSAKAPGAAFLGVPPYWAARRLDIIGPITDDPRARWLVRLSAVTLPFAASAVVMRRLLLAWGAAPRAALLTVLVYGLATLSTVHALILSGHQTAASFLVFALALLSRFSFLAGLCAGLAVLSDYVSAAGALALAAAALALKPKARTAFFIGAGLCAAAWALYNRACFGSITSLSYTHLFYEEHRALMSGGAIGLGLPNPARLAALTFSPHRGYLFIMPVLLFAIAGAFKAWKARRRELLVMLAPVALAAAVVSSYEAWHGGWCYGSRYLVCLMPFIVMPMAFAPLSGSGFILLAGLSAAQVWLALWGLPHPAPEILNPVTEFLLPLLTQGAGAVSAFSRAPAWPWHALAALAACAFCAWSALAQAPKSPAPSRPLNALAVLLGLAVLSCLAWVKTLDQETVGCYRALALRNTAAVTRSRALAAAAEREMESAGGWCRERLAPR